jgi:hypothetical protein|tara:strand:+ start:400 stop:708 length:309 start_codon:yes stop_codon:yes gene_type:complete
MNKSDKAWLDICMHKNYASYASFDGGFEMRCQCFNASQSTDTLRRCFNAIMNEKYDAYDASTGALRILCQWNDPNGEYDDASRAEMIDSLYRWKWESNNDTK